MHFDKIMEELSNLKGDLPKPRPNLSEGEKDQLIIKVGGYRTAQNIVKASKSLPLARIPFLFSSLDTQAVVDIMANDMDMAIDRAKALKIKKK